MTARWLVPVWLATGALASAYQGTTTTAPATGLIEGQVFSASTGAPLKKATVRLQGIQPPGAGGRGMAMGGGQAGRGGPQAATGQAQPQAQGGRGGAVPVLAGQPAQPVQAGQAGQSAGQLQAQIQMAVAGAMATAMPNSASRTTDETGRFSFPNLAAGQYRISVERQGYLRQSYGARKYNTSGTPVTLKENGRISDIVVRMNPQSVIVGKVLDEDGDPMVGLEVRAMKSVYRNGKKVWSVVNSGETNDIGVYRIPELDPGQYIVATAAQNGRGGGPGPMGRGMVANEPLPQTPESIYAATYFPNGVDSTAAVPIDLAAGSEMSGIDIRLRKSRVFRIRGKISNVPVLTAGGRGAGGGPSVMVNLMSSDGSGRGPGTAARPPEYAFEIRGVSPGTYTLMATANGGMGGGPGGGPGGRGGSTGGMNGMMAIQQVSVGSNHVDGLVLQLAAGAEIQGTIKVEGASTPVSMPNVNVALRSTAQPNAGGAPRARVTDDSKFTLSGVSPLPYSVTVTGIPDNCYVKSIRYSGLEVPEDGMSMAAGGPMEVTLSATAGSISATISDKNGNPIENATVALYPKDGPVSAAKSASSNESGGVTFKGLKPAEYRLVAWEDIPSGAYLDPVFVKPYESRGESVKVSESGAQTVQVRVIPASETDR